jgi:CSLREA domain-containing protein
VIWGTREVGKRRRTTNALIALACVVVALTVAPAFASATIFTVNSVNDEAKTAPGAICEATIPGQCTLRAAIEAANDDTGPDQIRFGAGVNELEPTTALPAITEPLTLLGQSVNTGSYLRPSVGIKAPNNAAGLTIESSEVTVQQMAFGGGRAGIEVLDGSEGFVATGDWFGLRLDATAQAIDTAGILLGPGADGATIGSDQLELANRNVFANSELGIELDGASDTKILGNYFGVGPDGEGPATLTNGISVTDYSGVPPRLARHNDIGGVLTGSQAATANCDGACNVIAVDGGFGVSIAGESSGPAEPTTVRGNFVGLGADGVTPIGEDLYGVFVASVSSCGAGPTDVTVGGTPDTEGNHIVGGLIAGIYAEGAENFTAAGNSIGIAADGSESSSPQGAGIAVCAEGVTRAGHVADNRMKLSSDAVGIESSFGHADIADNTIEGSQVGILTNQESEGHGGLIEGNAISDPDVTGIEIANDSNVVIGNTVSGAGQTGILVNDGDHNRIGGDAPGEANTISSTGVAGTEEEAAIEITGPEALRNEVAANLGSANFGPFIRFSAQSGSERINGGIEPPVFATALQSSASGNAAPDSTVRIFGKSESDPGELGPLLAKVVADSSGAWKATYPKVALGSFVAATATTLAGTAAAGTSEVSGPAAVWADPVEPEKEKEKEGGGGGGGDGGGGSGGTPQPGSSGSRNQDAAPLPAPGPTAPEVKITKGPKKSSQATTAKFKFTATPAAGAKFECKLDGAKWARCSSPKTYKRLGPGKHTFRVRATGGGVARYAFTVKA